MKKVFLALFTSIVLASVAFAADDADYELKLKSLQNQLLSQQKDQGEWAGINEGDPRWDMFFLGYSYALYNNQFKFMTKEKFQRVLGETIYRLKNYRGYQKYGWSIHAKGPISAELSTNIMMVLDHVNKDLAPLHFPTQYKFYKERGWHVNQMTVLDRSIFKMMGIKGEILFPFAIDPLMFSLPAKGSYISMANLGYFRWGFIALTVWRHFTIKDDLGLPFRAFTANDLKNKGYFISHPEKAPDSYKSSFANINPIRMIHARGFWGNEGLSWLLERPYGDGNPGPTLIVQMALLAAHKANVANLSLVLEDGWNYMNKLRYPMRNGSRVFQPSISPIWDTARVLSALQHLPENLKFKKLGKKSSSVQKALKFLFKEQDVAGGDYRMANPQFRAGGWGFAYNSRKYPDSDDTAMVVDALIPFAKSDKRAGKALQNGVYWLVQMQNANGGFPAWDFNATESIEYIIRNTDFLPKTSLEPQSDVTARVLRALHHAQRDGLVRIPESVFIKGCSYLQKKATKSAFGIPVWAGTWAVHYLYGSSEVMSTLLKLDCADGIDVASFAQWIANVQNRDGGWGEDNMSYKVFDFRQSKSSISQTLGALQFLLAYQQYRQEKGLESLPDMMKVIESGMQYYLQKMDQSGDIHDENEPNLTACYACPKLYVRYELIPLYMGTEVLGKFLKLKEGQ